MSATIEVDHSLSLILVLALVALVFTLLGMLEGMIGCFGVDVNLEFFLSLGQERLELLFLFRRIA